jgi:glycine dehydrogenase subunit 2
MGFDIVHLNLHKTFATPHGGGGPGAGPVGVRNRLARFLPTPRVVRDEAEGAENYRWEDTGPDSIGKVHGFHGNFGMLVRAYAYILRFGAEGLRQIGETAVLNANWLKRRLQGIFDEPHRDLRKHEFVVSAANLKRSRGIRTLDIAKRLLDHGVHAPTVYFPLVVDEALMIEPTESEPLDEMERFATIIEKIVSEDPEIVKSAPHTTPVGRLDEAWAARNLVLTWQAARERIDDLAPEE